MDQDSNRSGRYGPVHQGRLAGRLKTDYLNLV